MTSAAPPAEPFFLPAAPGRRFCLYHAPNGTPRGAVLYVHPFAEEMNRARRMAALQARALARAGYGVLQLDLYGCGDSDGDFGDARWAIWQEDLARGAAWLHARLGQPLTLWGLRLGALLAAQSACDTGLPVHSLLLWQPVQKGPAYLTQFLRLRMAGALLDGSEAHAGTDTLRRMLQDGQPLEIAGYDLAPELAAAIDALPPLDTLTPPCPVHWFEAVNGASRQLPAGAARVTNAWRERGVDLQMRALACPPFWATPEIAVSDELITLTTQALLEHADAA
jgi:exosortase A-associated hydrolase 2